MSAERKALRADLLTALAAAQADIPVLAGRPVISAWTQDLSPEALPVIGLAVPLEEREPASQDTDLQELQAIVVVKIAHRGGDDPDLEDALDDIAEDLVGPLEVALMTLRRDVALKSSAIQISKEGSPRIGTLTLTFAAQTWRSRTRP